MSSAQGEYDPYAPRRYSEYFSSDEQRQGQNTVDASSSSTGSSRLYAVSAGDEESVEVGSEGWQRDAREHVRHGQRTSRSGQTSSAEQINFQAPRAVQLEDEEEAEAEETAAAAAPPGDEQDEESDTDAFYALLNVQKDASEEQIRDAYKTLAVALHPDKHTSPSLKTAAENRFRAVQRAYEVLSDAEKRSVYDHFGTRGLNHSWSVARRSNQGGPQTAAELREEWERVARQRKAEALDNMVRSRGEYVVNLDASSLLCSEEQIPRGKDVMRHVARAIRKQEEETGKPFQPGDTLEVELPDVTFAERWRLVKFTSLTGKHGWEVPLTMYTRLSLNGQMISRNGMGGGNVIGTLRTQWNGKLSTEASLGLLHPRTGSLKAHYALTKFTYVSVAASGSTLAVPPQLQASLHQRLSHSSQLIGYTSFRSGPYTLGSWGKNLGMGQQSPGMAIGVQNVLGNGSQWQCAVELSSANQALSIDYSYKPAILGSPKARVGLTLGLASGLNAIHSLDRKVTENVTLGMSLMFGIPTGNVTLQLRFKRLGQRLLVPIQLSPTYRPDIVAAFTILPGLGLLAAEHFYLRPLRKNKVRRRLVDLRAQHKDLIRERRRAALEAIDVFRANARKRAHQERQTGGIVVLEAYYGKRDTWPALQDDEASDVLFERVWGSRAVEAQANGTTSEMATAMSEQAEVNASVNASTGGEAEDEMQAAEQDRTPWCDVTVAVMMLVQRGQLIIPGGRQKHKLLGFYDPCMGERKHLVVRYLFRERLHHVIVDDATQLTAPLRSHAL